MSDISARLTAEELRHILDHVDAGVVVAAQDGKLVVLNIAAEELASLQVDASGQTAWSATALPGAAAPETHPLALALRGEAVEGAEVFLRTGKRPEGCWVRVHARPLRDERGEVRGGVMVLRDVTQARAAAAELSDTQARFHAIFHTTFDFTGLLSPDGTLLEANRAALDFIGKARADVVGRPFWETPWWEQSEPARTRLSAAIARAAQGEFQRFDVTHADASGRARVFDFSLKPVAGASGRVEFLIAEGRDVEEHRRSSRLRDRELREKLRAESRFRELLNAAPDAILEVDHTGTIVVINPMAERLFGYAPGELLGRSVDVLVPEAARARHHEHRAAFGGQPATRPMGTGLDLIARRKDGSTLPVEISLSPIPSGDGTNVVAIVRDVSTRRRAEVEFRELQDRFTRELEEKNRQLEQRNAEVERSNRLKSEFLASMSHELRSPLHTIIGFAELLSEELEGPLNDKQKRFVRNIHQDSHHLLAIINDLLDISKIEAGRMEFHPEPFEVAPAAEEVLAMIQPQAEAKSLHIERRLAPGIEVEADRLRFKQILMNLLTNAVKFTPEGGRIAISSTRHGGRATVSVADTGIGIARQDHEAIFDKFYQVGSTTKGVREGTGLGLAITKKLVEQHQGRIWVESDVGRGSTFTFTVPALSPTAAGKGRERRLVLIVEDEPHAAELLVNFLEPEGFDTLCAGSTEQALSMAAELAPDAIVVDLSVPSSAEWRMIREIRTDPETGTTPIVVVSVTDEMDAARALGAEAHLTKPVSKRQLLETLAACIRQSAGRAPVLVVDDEPMARELVGEFLREAGYHALLAQGGAEALALLVSTRPAAVILDLLMPAMSGFEVLSRIRENPAWAGIPIIVLTGLELNQGDIELLERTSVAILHKGHSWKPPLLGAIKRALARSSSPAPLPS